MVWILCHINIFPVQTYFHVAGAIAVLPRPMDPNKDLAVYGYGSVAWKERVEEWKKKQNEKLEVVKHEGDNNVDEFNDPDLPK